MLIHNYLGYDATGRNNSALFIHVKFKMVMYDNDYNYWRIAV